MLPRVILHPAVSIDGQINRFDANLQMYYGLIARWREDATLVETGTVLRATQIETAEEPNGDEEAVLEPTDTRPLMVVSDISRRVRTWSALRHTRYSRGATAPVGDG
jgi:2,5-diamino-6-(ribosylamino)-4(3H)-pyrimidinone 5'-phosphate reductase